MPFKKIISKVHLILGLACGVVVFVSMLAAALFTWDVELTDWYYSDYIFLESTVENKHVLPLEDLWDVAQRAVPNHPLSEVEIERDPEKAYIFMNYKDAPESNIRIFWWDDYAYWEKVYVDPYKGEVLGVVDMRKDWIYNTRMLHQYLLLTYDVGHLIVGISTLIVIVLVFTGLILWFPKRLKNLRQRLTLRLKSKWRRINYDLHQVGGFYLYSFILILAITGLVWTFSWWTNGIYWILGNDPKEVWETHEPLILEEFPEKIPFQVILNDHLSLRSSWTKMSIYLPGENASNSEIGTYLAFEGNSGWDEWDSHFYHPQTGERLASHWQENKTLGAKWRNSNYAIHVGSIYGLPTKILACLSALGLAFLPVTGFLIWYGRKKKEKKKISVKREVPVGVLDL